MALRTPRSTRRTLLSATPNPCLAIASVAKSEGIIESLVTESSTFLKLKTFANWESSFPQAPGP